MKTTCRSVVQGLLLLPLFWGSSSPMTAPASGQTPIFRWKVAGPYPADRVDRGNYPNFYAIFLAPWQEAMADGSGFVDLNVLASAPPEGGALMLVRTSFLAEEDGVIPLRLEYSSEVDLFFNGWRVFSGKRAHEIYRKGASGTAPPSPVQPAPEEVPLFAKRGMNEILLMVSGEGAPLGFRASTDRDLQPLALDHAAVEELWVTPDTFLTPESVLKDPLRDLIYVSNFDNEYSQKPEPSGYISRLGLDGDILDLHWIDGLHAPTGMDIWRDTLFVAERENLLAIDLASGTVAGRWPIPDPVFPNDLVIDEAGTVYISDTRTGDWAESRIYRFREGAFDIFANEGISRANGLWVHDGRLIVGNSGDGLLKAVELTSGRMTTLVSFGAGIIDGIRVDDNGDFLVSRWEGQLFRISPTGEIVEILDALPTRWNTADFEYLPAERLLLVPTFLDNRVRALRIRD